MPRFVGRRSNTPTTAARYNSVLPGNETTVSRWSANCSAGSRVELWTINGGSHIPSLSATFSSSLVDFLLAHPKP